MLCFIIVLLYCIIRVRTDLDRTADDRQQLLFLERYRQTRQKRR